jgi:hypothetical protein
VRCSSCGQNDAAEPLSGLGCQEDGRVHRRGGVAVREATSEPSWPRSYGRLNFGCWSQHGGCTKHLLRVDVPGDGVFRETAVSADTAPEKLCCTLIPVFSIARAVSKDTPS